MCVCAVAALLIPSTGGIKNCTPLNFMELSNRDTELPLSFRAHFIVYLRYTGWLFI